MQATDEQSQAIELFNAGLGVAIEAGAGCGKTSVLRMLAETTAKRGQYVAFNKAIVEEAQRKMPTNVTSSTMHSIAYKSKGAPMRHRLNAGRITSSKIAQMMGMQPLVLDVDGKAKVLQPAYLASLAMRAITNFCASADKRPQAKHVPYVKGIDGTDDAGERKWLNNNLVSDSLVPYLSRAWDDLSSPTGVLPYKHDHYLKAYELDAPKINAEFILFDEAQDASPVMESIVFQQEHAQLVVVGDSQQAIYGWRGAVDALAHFKDSGQAYAQLSQSFRFGPAIADVANLCLNELQADLRLQGTPEINSEIGIVSEAETDAILTRTNAKSVSMLLAFQRAGRKTHLMGGGTEMLAFARAASDLMNGRWTSHADLACFDTWGAVQDYVDNDPSGDELKLSVSLVDEFGPDTIMEALQRMPKAEPGTLVISTAHKAKGCEWGNVRLGADFSKPGKDGEPAPPLAEEEWRLLYVAATRAQRKLDISACDPIRDLHAAAQAPQPAAL